MSVDPSTPGKLGKIRRVTRKIASSAAVSEKNLTRATPIFPPTSHRHVDNWHFGCDFECLSEGKTANTNPSWIGNFEQYDL